MWLAAAQALGGMTMGPKPSRSFFPNTVVLVVFVMADNILIAINSESLDGALEKGEAWDGLDKIYKGKRGDSKPWEDSGWEAASLTHRWGIS